MISYCYLFTEIRRFSLCSVFIAILLQLCSCHNALYYGNSQKDKNNYYKHSKEWEDEFQDEFRIIKVENYRTFFLIIAERKGLWYKIYSPYQKVDLDERIKLNKGMKVKLHLIAFYPPDHANFLHFIYFFSPFDGTNQEIYCDYKTGQKIYESPDIKSCYVNINNVISQK